MPVDDTKPVNRADVTRTGQVDSLDLQFVSQYMGQKSDWGTVTPPTGYTVEDLILDATGTNDGSCCPPVNSFDWGQHAKNGCSGRSPSGDQFTGWGTAQWLSCGASKAGARYQCRNLKVLGLKADHTWLNMGGGFEWVNEFDPNTTSGASGANGTPGDWLMPAGQRALHWATYRRSTPAGLIGIVTVYEARGDGIMANAGYDQISNGNIVGDLFISKYKKLDAVNWTHVGGSSVTQANLRAYPPPL